MKLSKVVYPLTKPNVSFAISIYHRKIFYSNAHRIPKNQPVLFVSNHPTAFLEPVIYAGLFDKPIYSLVRGDFFQNWLAKTGLESLNMIPIFRMRDGGVEGLRKNAETFQYCYDLIAARKQVLIMAEGFTKQQKRLAPLQKGAARLALGAAVSKKLKDLVIIPLGANFTQANKFRGEVMIEVGEPLPVEQYLVKYKEDKKMAIDLLTDDIETIMKRVLVHIESEEKDSFFEAFVPLARRKLYSTLWPSWNKNPERFNLEKRLADFVNNTNLTELTLISQKVSEYPKNINLRSNKYMLDIFLLVLGLPFWVVGKIYRWIPFSIARKIVKNKVETLEFESPIRFGMGALFFILWSWLMIILSAMMFGIKWVIVPLLLPLVVWISVIYEDLFEVVRQAWIWNKLEDSEKDKLTLIESEIFKLID